jgi:hypothetical protein
MEWDGMGMGVGWGALVWIVWEVEGREAGLRSGKLWIQHSPAAFGPVPAVTTHTILLVLVVNEIRSSGQ